jgi:sugar-specific transcriptional regulator TrmB
MSYGCVEKALEVFGLTKTEAHIYWTILQLGPSTAGIIARKAGVHRRSVYDATARLSEKGLLGYITKNNRKYFEAANPERLTELLHEKEQAVQAILPRLQKQYESVMEKQETLFYKGKNGLKTIFEDQLVTKKEIFILGASPLAQTLLQYYFHWFNKRREKKCIPIKLLYNELHRKRRTLKFATIKYLPKEFQNPAAMNIYGDNVAIIHWSKERPFAILIKDKEIAEGYRNYFKLLWGIARR